MRAPHRLDLPHGIDPEEFYDFSVQRPVVRLTESKIREIHWPSYDFYYGSGIGV